MAIETLSIALDGSDISGASEVSGDKDDNQIVTFTDGGNISGSLWVYAFGKDTPTELGAGDGGDDRFIIDLSNFDDDFEIELWSLDSGDVFEISNSNSLSISGTIYTYNYTGSDGQNHVFSIDIYSGNTGQNVQVVCFASGTGIATDDGEVSIEDLDAGDPVLCGDGVLRQIRWIGSRKVSIHELNAKPALRPISIDAGAFGPKQPAKPLKVSPQHKIMIRDLRAEILFGEGEVLVAAKHLTNDTSIRVHNEKEPVEYYHILLDCHSTVFANGLESETLHPGEAMNSAMSSEARSEICEIFPSIASDLGEFGDQVSPSLKSYEARLLNSLLAS